MGGAHATAFRSWPGSSGTKPRNMGMRGGLILSGENKYPSRCASGPRPQLSWNPDGINSRLETSGTWKKFKDRGRDPWLDGDTGGESRETFQLNGKPSIAFKRKLL